MYREQVTKADFSLQYKEACTTHLSVSVPSTSVARQWCLLICPIIIGLVALYFFLWMGGVFAFVGPWVILATSMWINWRRKKASVHLDM